LKSILLFFVEYFSLLQGGANVECVATATAKADLVGADLIICRLGRSREVNGSNAEL
jgi:hypothetical protein